MPSQMAPRDLSEEAEDIRAYYGGSDRELARRYLGERLPEFNSVYFEAAVKHRYDLYEHLPRVASFDSFVNRDVLEVGVGHGTDHYMFAKAGARMHGVDLTYKHCAITRLFLQTFGLDSVILQADARQLPFPDRSFDHVYSCGVLLLIEEIRRTLDEIHRVLRPGGSTTIMIYNKASIHYWLKTRIYYGWVLGEDVLLGRDTVNDWYTDGIGYPKTYHYGPGELRELFERFRRVEFRTDCLTPEQIPRVGLPHRERTKRWLEKRFGFFLWIRAWA